MIGQQPASTDAAAPVDAGNSELPRKTPQPTSAPSTGQAQPPNVSTPTGIPNVADDNVRDNDALTNEPGAESMDDEVPSRESSLPAGATQESLAEQVGAQTGATTGAANEGWSILALSLILLALFTLPILAGNYLARVWRMPDHGWKFSLVLGVLAAAILICRIRRIQIRARSGRRNHVDLRAGRCRHGGRIGNSSDAGEHSRPAGDDSLRWTGVSVVRPHRHAQAPPRSGRHQGNHHSRIRSRD